MSADLMFLASNEKAQAILLFGMDNLVREFLYSEFEALLDGYIPLEEYAGRTVRSVYVEINFRFHVVSAVFFLTTFDARGMVDASWNLPLADLARTTTTGPDMGSGPIHLACASQCPVALYREKLWDPDLKSHSSQLNLIKNAITLNKMGLHFKASDVSSLQTARPDSGSNDASGDSSQMNAVYDQDLRNRVAQLLKDQRFRIATMNGDKALAIRELRLEYAEKMEVLRHQLENAEASLSDALKRNAELKHTIDGQAQKIEGLREYFEHKLQRSQGGEEVLIESLRQHYEAAMSEKLFQSTKELSDRLAMKEMELVYRQERERQLTEEVAQLRREEQALVANSGDHLLERMSRQGVNFVTYQAGVGHITIPLSQIGRFMENPVAFTAAYCGVSERHYSAWLSHYQMPVCEALDGQGNRCCADVPRVGNPELFVVGESSFCPKHSQPRKPVSLVSVPR